MSKQTTTSNREQQMYNIASDMQAMLYKYSTNTCPGKYCIYYDKPDADSISNYSEWERLYHKIQTGDEYFIIYENVGAGPLEVRYVVNVTADSELTAASELMDMIARKF